MEENVRQLIKAEKPHLIKYKKYILENSWEKKVWNEIGKFKSDTDVRKEEFDLHNSIVLTILNRLKSVVKKSEGSHHFKVFKDFVKDIKDLIKLHSERAENYTYSSNLTEIESTDLRSNEIAFHRHLHLCTSTVIDTFTGLNIRTEEQATEGIVFHNETKAPLSMYFDLITEYPEIQEKLDTMGIDFKSEPKNEMFINMENVPKWDLNKHFWEQIPSTLQLFVDEFKKCRDGVFIDGEFISPWMYYHINFFTTSYPETKINKFTGKEETTDTIGVPPLRDNEWWVIQDNYLKAKEKGLMMFIAATRRAAKTTMIASHLAWCMTIGKRRLLCAGGSTKDLGQIKDNFIIDSQKKHPAFRTPNLVSDWTETVDYGIKKKDGKNIVLSSLKIVNLNKGGEKSSELLAGFTPDAFIIDEIMKAKFLDQLAAVKPALDQPGGKRCVGILSGTSGNEELAKDAFTVLNNPDANDVLQMDFELFNSRVPEEHITWRKRKFGTFIPAQMSAKDGLKKLDSTLADYLNKPNSKELKKIKIKVTDWAKAKEVIDLDRKKKSTDLALLTKEILYHPIDPEEMFLSGKTNPFPVEELKRRKEELLETGECGKKVTLIQQTDGKISYELSSKALAEYPHNGGFVDAPVVIYEELPEVKPPRFLYVAGFDDYKQEESDTDSIGAFHIYKVNIGMDKWCGRIVASIASRPDPHMKLYRQIFLLQQAYNALCFMENADDGYKQYLERKRVADLWLQESLDFKADMAQKSTNKRKFGWTPTPANIKFLKGLAIGYTKEEFTILDDQGKEITILGAQRLNDIGLIQEMIDYREDNNVDRITSFMSCLGLEYYLDVNYMLPKIDRKKQDANKKVEQPKQKNLSQVMFGSRNRNPF